jgi:hypothetical protein
MLEARDGGMSCEYEEFDDFADDVVSGADDVVSVIKSGAKLLPSKGDRSNGVSVDGIVKHMSLNSNPKSSCQGDRRQSPRKKVEKTSEASRIPSLCNEICVVGILEFTGVVGEGFEGVGATDNKILS